ncbi:MAG: CHASE4 domain-containing protein [Thermodesulfobacteriota bacterium]
MTIKKKMTLLLVSVFLFCGLFVSMIYSQLFLKNFLALESTARVKDMERVRNALDSEIGHMGTRAWDWAAWDDTYEYVVSRSPEYEDANLVDATFTDNHVNLIYICDTSGRVVYGRIVDLETQEDIALPEFPRDALPPDHALLLSPVEGPPQKALRKGVIMTARGPMLVAASPILTSSNEGPSRGTLIMGTFFNDAYRTKIESQTRVRFRTEPGVAPGPAREPHPEIIAREGAVYELTRDSDSEISVRTVFKGVDGRPAITLTALFPRDVVSQGRRTIYWAVGLSLFTIGLCFFFLFLMVWKMVLNPVGELAWHAGELRRGKDLGSRIALSRNDEIGMLGDEFDALMAEIQAKEQRLTRINEDLNRDIEKRHRAEEALRVSEQYFRSLLQSMHEAILVVDREGVVRDANREDLSLFRTTRQKSLGINYGGLIAGFAVEGADASRGDGFLDVCKTGEPVLRRLRGEREGEALVLEVLASPLREPGGEISRLILAFRDVTREARLSERVSEMQKTEAVSTFAGGVAHDFNNILMSMMLNIEYAAKKTGKDGSVAEALAQAHQAGEKASGLIAQLLAFSRGGGAVPQSLSLTPLVKETLKAIQSQLPSQIAFSTGVRAVRDTVFATPAQIRSLLMNLCANSVQAMARKPGVLGVRMQNPAREPFPDQNAPEDFRPENWISLTVSDTGCGMPADVKARIFDPFFTTKGPGAGLGLSVVHGIVKGKKGFVHVVSEPDKGTEMCVWLPVTADERGAARRGGPPGKKPVRVLLAEPDLFVARTLAGQLRETGLIVTEASSGQGALDVFIHDPGGFDVAVLDHSLTVAGGASLPEEMARIRPEIPVFLSAGFSDTPADAGKSRANIRGIFRKPLVASSLYAKILDIFDKKD